MKWVTWQHIGVDRMACIWLILRFIDTAAEFAFVPAATPHLPQGYEPFDMPGVRFTHRGGHSTFHTILREYGLSDGVLQRIAQIVDEADIVQDAAVEPTAAGLDLICRGLRLISPDDQTALHHGCLIYDALYAALQSEVTN